MKRVTLAGLRRLFLFRLLLLTGAGSFLQTLSRYPARVLFASAVDITTVRTREMPRGIYFCEVKGVTHANDDGTSRRTAQERCVPGDTVQLIPEPRNPHDRHAIRVVLQTGQQIGYVSARQAARFEGRVHLLTATVYSSVEDQWGNDTVKLRVVDSSPAEAQVNWNDATAAPGRRSSRGIIFAAAILIILGVLVWWLTAH